MVTIQADRAGLQLAKFGDVRINGVLVGQVRDGRARTASRRSSRSRSSPTRPRRSPRTSACRSCPTTLFGQKFISFVAPDDPSATSLAGRRRHPGRPGRDQRRAQQDPGRPVPAAARRAARRPELHAQRARHRARRPRRAARRDPRPARRLPRRDQRPPADPASRTWSRWPNVADTYDLAAPDLIDVLGNLTVTSKTVIEKADELDSFFSDLEGLADTSTRVLSDNETEPDPGRPGHRAGAQAARDLLAGVPLPASRAPPSTHRAWPRTFEGNQVKQYIEFGTAQYERLRRATTARCTARSGTARGATACRTPRSRRTRRRSTEGSDIDENPPHRPLIPACTRTRRPARERRPAATPAPTPRRQIVNALLAGETGRRRRLVRRARVAALRPGRQGR